MKATPKAARFLFALVVSSLPGATRAQTPTPATVLFTPSSCASAPYSDVDSADPACPWIEQLKVDQISTGCGGGRFCPDDPVTRRQLAAMLEKSMRGTATWDPWRGDFQRLLVVSPTADPIADGTRLRSLVQSIPGPGYTVYVESGFYNLNGQPLDLPDETLLVGSGRLRTLVYSTRGGPVVTTSGYAMLRDLELRNDSPYGAAAGLDAGGNLIELDDVRVRVAGGYGLNDLGAGSRLRRADVRAGSAGPPTAYGATGSSITVFDSVFDVAASSHAYGLRLNGDDNTLDGVQAGVKGDLVGYAVFFENGTRNRLSNSRLAVWGGPSSSLHDGVRANDADVDVDTSYVFSTEPVGQARGIRCIVTSGSRRLFIRGSVVYGESGSIQGESGCSIYVAASELGGGNVSPGGGTVTCTTSYGYGISSPGLNVCP